MDVELGSLTLKEEHRLKVFENWVLRTVLYLEVISSIHNLRPCHVKRDPLNMEY